MKNWFRIGLFNLILVALYGMVMRYKIAFDFPLFDQKNLLHAHSHFAFSGWLSHFLYAALLYIIHPYLNKQQLKKYNVLIIANLVCAFGMLVAFTIQGYKFVSIALSTASLVVAVFYAWYFIRDSKYLPAADASKPWAVWGLILNVLASAGPFSLAYMIATKNISHEIYLGSIYYYLHFQYSGWFFFATVAVAAHLFSPVSAFVKPYFKFFAITVIPTFFLSILWAKLPMWLYVITVVATFFQLGAWILLLRKIWAVVRQSQGVKNNWSTVFFGAAALAVTFKFILQAVSVVPSLSQLVFGFRPIVIAYLHLVLLGVYSLFIIGYLFQTGYIRTTKANKAASCCFLAGVVLNEAFLATQGIGAFSYLPVPYINEMLLGAAVVLCGSAAWLFLLNRRQKQIL